MRLFGPLVAEPAGPVTDQATDQATGPCDRAADHATDQTTGPGNQADEQA